MAQKNKRELGIAVDYDQGTITLRDITNNITDAPYSSDAVPEQYRSGFIAVGIASIISVAVSGKTNRYQIGRSILEQIDLGKWTPPVDNRGGGRRISDEILLAATETVLADNGGDVEAARDAIIEMIANDDQRKALLADPVISAEVAKLKAAQKIQSARGQVSVLNNLF